ncbi:MAG: hypothetical protein Q8O67_20050 [Deltaproteobacteria bacterium]|nr:hypothetical protein [Deltaproteobacteria bacterium]
MKFSELVRGASLRGAPTVFTPESSLRLGRAVGTLLRRRSDNRGPVVVARGGEGAELTARDGLVQGLVLSGFDVVDLGRAESDLFTFALRSEHATGGALVGTTGESVGVMLFAGPRPLVGETLVELARVAEDGGFCAGAGTLQVRDLRGAFRLSASVTDGDTVEEE